MKRSIIAAALVAALMPGLAMAETLTVWTRIPEAGAKPFFDAFEKANPDIHLQVEYIPGGKNQINKLVAAVAAGTQPDAVTLDVVATEQFAGLDSLLALDPVIAKDKNLSPDLFPAGPAATGRYKDKTYALPFGGDVSFVVYNRALFKERGLDPDHPPATWDAFAEAARKLTFDRSGNGKPDVYGFLFVPSQPWLTTFYWLPYFWMAGGHFSDPAKLSFTFDDAAGVKALDFLMNLHLKDHAVLPSAIGAAATTDGLLPFLQKSVAMAFAGPSDIARIGRDAPDLDVGVMPHPSPTSEVRHTSFSGGDNVAIMKAIPEAKLPAAIKLIEWLTSVEGQRTWYQTGYFIPVRKELLDDPYYQKFPLKKAALQAYLDAHEPPVTSHYTEVQQMLRDAFEQVAFGMASSQDALTEAARRATALAKRTGQL
jgi:multiple sugar transport system substrate-binding protein